MSCAACVILFQHPDKDVQLKHLGVSQIILKDI